MFGQFISRVVGINVAAILLSVLSGIRIRQGRGATANRCLFTLPLRVPSSIRVAAALLYPVDLLPESFALNLLCGGTTASYVTEVVIAGITILSMIGILLYVKRETFDSNVLVGERYFRPANIAVLFSVLSLFNDLRLLLAVGLAIACKEFHGSVSAWGRMLAQTIGERILEPPRDH